MDGEILNSYNLKLLSTKINRGYERAQVVKEIDAVQWVVINQKNCS